MESPKETKEARVYEYINNIKLYYTCVYKKRNAFKSRIFIRGLNAMLKVL